MKTVKVTFDNGNSLVSSINGTPEGVRAYYIGRTFNLGDGENDLMAKGVSVEFLIAPVAKDSIIYNAQDAPGHLRGVLAHNKPVACIYSVWKIENGMAYCQARNAWQQILEEVFPVNTLVPYYP